MSLFEKRPLALASLALLLASLATLFLTLRGISPLWLLIPFAIFVATALFLLRKKIKGAPLCVALVLFLLPGVLSQWLYAASLHSPLENVEVEHRVLASVEELSAENSAYRLYTVSVTEIDGEPKSLGLHLRVPRSVSETELSPREELTVTGYLDADYTSDTYYYSEGIAGRMTAEELVRHGTLSRLGLHARLRSLNARLGSHLMAKHNHTEGSLITALLLGNREFLPNSVSLAFRRAGLSHTLALSGMHLSVLTLLLRRILRCVCPRRILSCPLLLVFIWGYTLLSGIPLSLLRAAIMLTVAELGTLLRRQSDPVTSLFFAVALIVLLSPGAAIDLGLWLSFLATLGILVANDLLAKGKRKRGGFSRLLKALLLSVALTTFATLFTLAVSAFAFGEISLLSPLANLLVSPLVSLLLILSPPLLLGNGGFYARIVTRLAALVLSLVERLSSHEGIYVSVSYPLLLAAILAFSLYAAFLLVRRLDSAKAFLLRFSSATLLLAILFLSCHLYNERRDLLLYVRGYDGEYLVISSHGHTTVIDNSNEDSALYSLRRALKETHITEIDTLILTQYTDTSPAYLHAVADALHIGEVLLAQNSYAPALKADVLLAATARGLAVSEVNDPLILTVGNTEIRLLSDLVASHLTRPALFLHARSDARSAVYASRDALPLFPKEVLDSLLASADCVVIGKHPDSEIPLRLPHLPLPSGSTLIAPPAVITPDDLGKDVDFLISPSVFLYSLK